MFVWILSLLLLSSCTWSDEKLAKKSAATEKHSSAAAMNDFLKKEINYGTEVYGVRLASLDSSWSNINSKSGLLAPLAPLFQYKERMPFVYINFKIPNEFSINLPEALLLDVKSKQIKNLSIFFIAQSSTFSQITTQGTQDSLNLENASVNTNDDDVSSDNSEISVLKPHYFLAPEAPSEFADNIFQQSISLKLYNIPAQTKLYKLSNTDFIRENIVLDDNQLLPSDLGILEEEKKSLSLWSLVIDEKESRACATLHWLLDKELASYLFVLVQYKYRTVQEFLQALSDPLRFPEPAIKESLDLLIAGEKTK